MVVKQYGAMPNRERFAMSRLQVCVLCMGAALWLCSSAVGLDAQRAFDEVFGAEAKQVKASHSAKEEARFAAKLLESAGTLSDSPALKKLVLENAYEFGLRSADGCVSAAAAGRQLAEADANTADEWDKKVLDALQRRYSLAASADKRAAAEELLSELRAEAQKELEAGHTDEAVKVLRQAGWIANASAPDQAEALQAELKAAMAQAALEARMAGYRNRLKANPGDAAARAGLIDAYLRDLDDPNEAAKLVDSTVSESLRTYVPMAVRPPEELAYQACKEMGDWYRSLADRSVPFVKEAMLRRADGYYARFQEKYSKEDALSLVVKLAREKVQAELAKLAGASAPAAPAGSGAGPDEWRDMIKFTDFTRINGGGAWKWDGTCVRSTRAKPGDLIVSAAGIGAHEANITLTRIGGTDGIWLFFSVNGHSPFLEAGTQKHPSWTLMGLDDKVLARGQRAIFFPRRKTSIQIRAIPHGSSISINVSQDGKSVLAWKGPASEFRKDDRLDGIGFNEGQFAVISWLVRGPVRFAPHIMSPPWDRESSAWVPRNIMDLAKKRHATKERVDQSRMTEIELTKLNGNEPVTYSYNVDQWHAAERRVIVEKAQNLTNLLPLYGIPTRRLNVKDCPNLKSLQGIQGMMPCEIEIRNCPLITDLPELRGMDLTDLRLEGLPDLKDLDELKGMPISFLSLNDSRCDFPLGEVVKTLPLRTICLGGKEWKNLAERKDLVAALKEKPTLVEVKGANPRDGFDKALADEIIDACRVLREKTK
jgi:plasmid stabilization system protein ParE